MKNFIMRLVTTFITSAALRGFRRKVHAYRRKRSLQKPTVHYFHQVDDPYSHVAAQALGAFAKRYNVVVTPWLVSAPDDAAAPEREKLRHYALRDAARLAREYGFEFPDGAALPEATRVAACANALAAALKGKTFIETAAKIGAALWHGEAGTLPVASDSETAKTIAAGDKKRSEFGHYLSAMFYFEGEWYWGIDRLHYLETRLREIDLDTMPAKPEIAPYRDLRLATPPKSKSRPVIEYWFSFRSPYSWISAPRMRRLAKHYDCELQLRFILPMVMRGLPVPAIKRMYITLDTKREAESVGLPFGTIIDPVGAGAARALAVLNHAIPLGHGEAFAELGMRAAFADGIALASDAGMLDVAKRAGLTEAQMRAGLADESWQTKAEANREALFAAGLWGAPSFRVDGKPAHWGQDRFWALEQDILDAIVERNARA